MKYYIDTEFCESGPHKPIDLISIGIVAEDGRELYAVSAEFNPQDANDWVKENVLPHLGDAIPTSLDVMAVRIERFMYDGLVAPEFWGYYCVAPKTLVLTADLKWVSIDALAVGDSLAGFDEEAPMGKGRSKKWRAWRNSVVKSLKSIDRPCFDLTFSDGTKIRCSADHKWLTVNQKAARWTTTENLRCSPTLSSNIVKPVDVWSERNSKNAGYLAAAFDAEGHITQRDLSNEVRGQFAYRLGFAQKDNPMLTNVKRILREFDYHPTTEQIVDGVRRLNIGRREEVMRFLGEMRPHRLLPKFDINKSGAITMGKTVKLVSKVNVGIKPVIGMTTSTGTFIAEGLASHNCDYDWVVFCQIFGRMIDLPKGWPMYAFDIKQLAMMLGNPKLPEQDSTEHNALNDARWNKMAYDFLIERTKYVIPKVK